MSRVVEQVTIEGHSDGLKELSADLNKVSAAQDKVASSSKNLGTVTEQSSRKVRSLESAYNASLRAIDPMLKQRQDMEAMVRKLDAGFSHFNVSATEQTRILGLVQERWGGVSKGMAAANQNIKLTSGQVQGLGYQINDIGTMLAMPEPEAGESVDTLRAFVNVEGEEDFVMVVSWLVAALRSRGPYPILVVNGEQGSGKSTFSRLVRSIVDPNVAPIRAAPKDDRDLMVAVVNNHVSAFDNLSRLDPWLADALCRVSTGGGFATRALHTDRDENVVMATRPIILNGIPALTERPDLSERAIGVRLKTIPEDERRPEEEFWADWDKALPRVLGALCDALSGATRRLPGLRLEKAPRLADFAKLMVASEPGLGWEPGTFQTAYADNRRDQSDTTFEADPVAIAIRNLMRDKRHQEGWNGTATELLVLLSERVSENVKRSRAWPMTAQALGNRIDRVAPLLRNKKVRVERRHSGIRTIAISRIED